MTLDIAPESQSVQPLVDVGGLSPNELLEDLSARELDVLMAMSDGLSNPEISQRLHISINTVKTHLKKIYEKIQVKNRTQALVKAQTMGLVR